MKIIFLALLLTGCATQAPVNQAPRLQAYDLSNHAKSGRTDGSAIQNKTISANHPVFGQPRFRTKN